MRTLIIKLFSVAVILMAVNNRISAQQQDMAWPGPKGVFIFTGDKIPTGQVIYAYQVERTGPDSVWVKIGVLRTPATFQQFLDKVNDTKKIFPDQPLPASAKLEQLFKKALATGTVDSLTGWKNYPVRMALGVMYYDDHAVNGKFRYRISEVDTARKVVSSVITNAVSMPHTAKFDPIMVDESSRTAHLNYIRWYSAGNNPAPLFQPFRFENGKNIAISGWTSRNSVNDTSYYTFTDSVPGAIKAEQFFIVPFDPFGNAGAASEILKTGPDRFTNSKINKVKAGRIPDKYGIRVSWFYNAPKQIKNFIIYRSENKDKGFREYTRVPSADTVYCDVNAWPGHTYYYYLKAYDTTGKRFITSEKAWYTASLASKPGAPKVTAEAVKGGVKLTVDVNDDKADGVRIFRNDGLSEQMIAITQLIPLNGKQTIEYTDSSENLSGRHNYCYQVRSEAKDAGVSELSEKATAKPLINTPPADPAFIRGSVADNKINLLWQEAGSADSSITGYKLTRREMKNFPDNGQAEGHISSSPVTVGINTWSDTLTKPGYIYSYIVQSRDKEEMMSPGAARIIISLAKDSPIPPDYIKAKEIWIGKPAIMIEWAEVMYEGFTQIKLFRQSENKEAELIATLKPGNTHYVDKIEGKPETYSYFIKTVHSSGTESKPSATAKSGK
ncbi:MAG TPA: hypothetical protein PLJ84_03380 [Bacteroidales bacterium]|nr:hypothetical protein [Bacteroidales bacterium]HPT01613.1 hypothetical protein [Bacteroidales bacterium]